MATIRRLPRSLHTGGLVLRLLLVVLLVLVGAVAFEALRAHRLQRAVLAEALREYASFAAWRFLSGVEEKLYIGNVARLSIGGLRPGDPRAWLPRPDELRAAHDRLARCDCAYVAETRFHFRVERDGGGAAREAAPGDGPAIAVARGETAPPALLRWLADTVLRDAAAVRPDPMIFRTFFATPPGEAPVAVVYYAPAADSAAPPAAVGFVAPLDAFLADLAAAILRDVELLPRALTGDVPVAELLAVTITDASGRVLVRPAVAYGGDYAASVQLHPSFGGPTVAVALNPARAPSLIPGGTARARIGLLLQALAVTVVLVLVALWQLRREQQLVRLRADFTSSVSHELRTPLAQILLFGETLSSDRARSEGERRLAIGVIVREARRLIHMVENVLHFARSERRLAYLEPEPLALAALVEETVQGFAPLAQPAGVRWALALDPRATARVDRNALRQVVLNLLDNAVKYGRAGQTLAVGVARHDGRVRLWVDDEGPGVPADRRAEIWRPFARLAHGASAARTGAGIGLAVVQELVEMHDGRAWVEDAPGGGARFVVEFPGEAPADAIDPADATAGDRGAASPLQRPA